jgi:hypothetical protein
MQTIAYLTLASGLMAMAYGSWPLAASLLVVALLVWASSRNRPDGDGPS